MLYDRDIDKHCSGFGWTYIERGTGVGNIGSVWSHKKVFVIFERERLTGLLACLLSNTKPDLVYIQSHAGFAFDVRAIA